MNVKTFLQDKIIGILFLVFAIGTIEIFLIPYQYGNFIKVYIPISVLFFYIIALVIEYLIKHQFYKNYENTLNELEDKYLISEIIKEPEFMEGKILKNSLEQINKSMNENVNKYKYMRGRL